MGMPRHSKCAGPCWRSERSRALVLLVAALFALSAGAREADGTLGLIETPNNGIPALLTPGGSFEAMLEGEAELRLVGADGGSVALETTFEERPGGRVAAFCTTPDSIAPGAYAIEGERDGAVDRTVRAVFVVAEFPEYYLAAHVTDTHVGSNRHPRTSEEIVGEVLSAVNKSQANVCLITGDLTDQGTPEQFRSFLTLLDTCAMPTFVLPGNHDRGGLHYESFFGPLTYAFTYGRDGYLAFDTKDFVTADELTAQDGELEILRRKIKASRWSVGLTHRYEPLQGMRSQLTLFVDNPLDVLLFGHWHHEPKEDQVVIPWGRTKWIVTPAAINGEFRLIDMTARGPLPRPVERAAMTGSETTTTPAPSAGEVPSGE